MIETQIQKKREIKKEIYISNIDLVKDLFQVNKNREELKSKPSYVKEFIKNGKL